MVTQTIQDELTKYAHATAADNECDYATAVKMLGDEPGEVVRDLAIAGHHVTRETVSAWCAGGTTPETQACAHSWSWVSGDEHACKSCGVFGRQGDGEIVPIAE